MDLAQATLGKASEMSLDDDSLAQLYSAIEAYDAICAKRIESMKLDYEKGNYHKVLENGPAICKLQPDDPNILLLLSAAYFMRGQYESSAQCLLQVKLPGNIPCVEVLNNLATIYLHKGQTLKARDYYFTAVNFQIDYMHCWINYIRTLMTIKDYDNANKSLNMIINYNSNFPPARYMCGNLKLALNKPDEALEQFKFAVQSDIQCALSWVYLGNVYLNTNKMCQAVECYERAIEINNVSITPRKNLGIAYLKLKQYEKSINMLTNVIQLCPNDIDVLRILSRVFVAQNKISSAVRISIICLKHEPDDPHIYYDMGVLYYIHMRNTQVALTYFNKCIDLDKDYELCYKYLIMIYQEQNNRRSAYYVSMMMAKMYLNRNDLTNAMCAYYFAFHICPQCYSTRWKLEHMFHKLQLCKSALLRFEKEDKLQPNSLFALSNSAFFSENQNPLKDARECYQEVLLKLQLDEVNSVPNLIFIKQKIDRIENHIELYDLLLKYNDISDIFDVHLLMANLFYKEYGDLKKSHFHLVQALNIRDIDFDNYITLGKISLELKKHNEALIYFHKAITINKESIIPHIYVGCIYKDNKQYCEAIRVFKKVLAIYPKHPDAYSNLVECQHHICDFKRCQVNLVILEKMVIEQLKENQMPCVTPQQSLMYNFQPEVITQIASKYAEQFVRKPYIEKHRGYAHNKSSSNGCIRIGYMYSDFSIHPASELVKSIQHLHDGKKFTVFCYSISSIKHSSREIYSNPNFIDVSDLSSIDAANIINENQIQILVDVNESSDSIANEILALKPAPIQIKLLGHPGTSGAKFVDYFITDRTCTPPNLKHYFTEKLVYLKRTVCFGDHKLLYNNLIQYPLIRQNSNTPVCSDLSNEECIDYTRDMFNIPENCFVICNFGRHSKINKTALYMWIQILNYIPRSVLWLLDLSKDSKKNIRNFVKAHNTDPDRVIFSKVLSTKDEHLKRIQLADLYVDTPDYSSPKSCLDSMWAGTPVLALAGKTFSSRMTQSLLISMGCTYMIANDDEEYVQIVVNLAAHKLILSDIRYNIWRLKKTNNLFNCKSYVENLEMVYLNVWNRLSNH